jgi:hypothetical protein
MKHLLMDAKEEILSLRRRNEILEAQVGVVVVFAAALGLKRNEQGMAEDVAWKLQKKIDELDNPPS